MEDEVLNFLEHHGVRGQKWGVRRRAKATRAINSGRTLTPGNKALVVAGGFATAKTVNFILRAAGAQPMGKVGSSAVAAGGALVARDLLKRHQQKSITQLKADLKDIRSG